MRATSSLPVPDSPQMCTGAWLRATRAIMSRSCSMTAELPSRREPCKVATVRASAPARRLIAQLDRTAHQLAQHAEIEGFGDEIEGAKLQGAHRGLDVAMGRYDRYRH